MTWPQTPGPYGWNDTPAQREQVHAEQARIRAQRARRNATRPARPTDTEPNR